ncbi:MAG: hypothetical protein AAF249_06520 [Pseudomonadota bacterium]
MPLGAIAFALLQAMPVVGTVPVRNEELDAAQACLAANTQSLLAERQKRPEKDERSRWATQIVESCDERVKAAADSREAISLQPNPTAIVGGGVSKRQALRSEAHYYVDGLIRKQFEKQS